MTASRSDSPRLSFGLIKQVLGLLDASAKRKLILYVLGSFVVSLTEVVGLATIMPLVQLITGAPIDEGYLAVIHGLLGEPPRSTFIVTLAVAIVSAFVLKAVLGLGMQWWGSGYTTGLQVGLQARLLTAFLTEGYARHRQRNTAEVVRATGQAAIDTFSKVLGGLMSLVSASLSVLVMLALLLAVLPVPTLVAIGLFAIAMLFIDRVLAPGNQRASRDYLASSFDSSKSLLESFQGFREIRMLNKEQTFIERFRLANARAAHASRRMGLLQVVPKYVLEILAIVGISIMLGVLAMAESSSALASVALFVAAAIRLLPSITAMTATLGLMRSGVAGAHLTVQTVSELDEMLAVAAAQSSAQVAPQQGAIEIENVTFQFPDGTEPVLRGVSATVPHGTSIAFCGSSGSGKTTLVDLILGLQVPDSGRVTYAGTDITDLRENWRARVGYIPQDVYLLDDSLAENVAYGERGPERDDERIMECLKLARLDTLVAEMPHGIHTQIGERGTRLSGGQRQRLGIARALYHRPSVIVMDEATSALDNETEDQIIQTIQSLRGELTTIMVAHRLSTVRDVDQLIFLEKGEVTARGTFQEVRRMNPRFAELVRLGDLALDAKLPPVEEDGAPT